MKKKWWIIAAVMLVLLMIGVGVAVYVANRPGVHVKDQTVRVNLEQPCYIYNQRTGSFEEMSTVTWKMKKSEIDDEELKGLGREVQAEKLKFSVAAANEALSEKAHYGLEEVWLRDGHLIYTVCISDTEYPPGDNGGLTVKRVNKLTYYADYELSSGRLCVQILTDEGGRLVALSGFESQEEAQAYLQGEGRNWTEEIYFDFPPTVDAS